MCRKENLSEMSNVQFRIANIEGDDLRLRAKWSDLQRKTKHFADRILRISDRGRCFGQ